MIRSARLLPAMAGLFLAAPLAASLAQTGAHFVIAAGATIPTGTFGDNHDVGYHGTVGIELRPPLSPLGFRVEGMYNEFNQSNGNDKAHAAGVIANAIYSLSQISLAPGSSLYAIGGIGYYSTKDPVFFDTSSQSNVGWNIGGGFRFPLTGFSAYVEARYHHVSNADFSFVPITFGLMF